MCIICFNKGQNVISISKNVHRMIHEYAIDGYSDDDDRLPSGICGTCRLTLSEYSKGVFKRPLTKYDHSTVAIRYETRSQVEKICQCVVCEIARGKSTDGGTSKAKRGRPSLSTTTSKVFKSSSSYRIMPFLFVRAEVW